MSVYLDHAATTKIRKPVLDFLKSEKLEDLLLGNASSVHGKGRMAKELLDESRQVIKEVLECEINEIIFTSGATESLRLAIVGGYLGLKNPQKNIYVSPLVHSSIISALNFLEKYFAVNIKFLPLDNFGFLDIKNISEDIFENADLIIVEHGNSEVGILQPVIKLGRKIEKWHGQNKKFIKPLFVVDGAASIVSELQVGLKFQKADLMTISAEKFGGLAGCGILLKSEKIDLADIQKGSQEWGYRGGTENISGVKSLSLALKENAIHKEIEIEKYKSFQVICRDFMNKNFAQIKIITPEKNSLPHIFTFLLPENFLGNVFVVQCDLKGLDVSSGSACSSGTVGGSKVLKSLGYSDEESERVIRISFGWDTQEEDVKKGLEIIKDLLV